MRKRGKRPMRMVTPEVETPGLTARLQDLRTAKALASCARPRAEVEAQIQGRRAELATAYEPVKRRTKKATEVPVHKGLVEHE